MEVGNRPFWAFTFSLLWFISPYNHLIFSFHIVSLSSVPGGLDCLLRMKPVSGPARKILLQIHIKLQVQPAPSTDVQTQIPPQKEIEAKYFYLKSNRAFAADPSWIPPMVFHTTRNYLLHLEIIYIYIKSAPICFQNAWQLASNVINAIIFH